mmetsp:Transcript_53469/g.121915  ORF Transcript_53469/g.121915 Transcript_53469/m.121915 type:complete len:244 (+) Transcript_53469:109-840(+)
MKGRGPRGVRPRIELTPGFLPPLEVRPSSPCCARFGSKSGKGQVLLIIRGPALLLFLFLIVALAARAFAAAEGGHAAMGHERHEQRAAEPPPCALVVRPEGNRRVPAPVPHLEPLHRGGIARRVHLAKHFQKRSRRRPSSRQLAPGDRGVGSRGGAFEDEVEHLVVAAHLRVGEAAEPPLRTLGAHLDCLERGAESGQQRGAHEEGVSEGGDARVLEAGHRRAETLGQVHVALQGNLLVQRLE